MIGTEILKPSLFAQTKNKVGKTITVRLHDGRGREISSDFVKMNSWAYVGTLEFIFTKSAQASRLSTIGLPVILLL